MQTLGRIEPVMLIIAGFSRHRELLDDIEPKLIQAYGPVAVTGPTIDFRQTEYYAPSMGTNLLKRYWAFQRLQEPDQLAAIKRQTIEMECEIQQSGQYEIERPINLDPGFLSLGKFILATTKDQAHRIYLHGGIFAEVTLRYHDRQFEPRPWTYADWQLPQVLRFLQEARRYYCQHKPATQADKILPPLLVRQNHVNS
jgi:hypothetical protein